MKNDSKFCITVGVIPDTDMELKKEIDFVKAALLYADTVNLCSIQTSIFFPVINSSPIQKFKIIRDYVKSANPSDLKIIDAVIKILEKKHIIIQKRK